MVDDLSRIWKTALPFQVHERKKGSATVLSLFGHDNRDAQNQLRRRMRAVSGLLVLDLKEFRVTTSAFVGLLALVAREKQKGGQQLLILNPPPQFLALARLFNLDDLFKVIHSESEIA